MRTLVVLAVMGVCSASYQANIPGPRYGVPVQPRWTGPVAATVPAGVGGKIIPVSDTPEVAAAKTAFYRAYENQLAAVRYGTPHYGAAPHASSGPGPHASSGPGPHASSGPGPHGSYGPGPHASSGTGPHASSGPGPHGSYGPRPHISAGPVVHTHSVVRSHVGPSYSHGGSAQSHSYGVPTVPAFYFRAPAPVGDTADVAAAKAEFFRTYERQAAAAAAAPDHYTYH